MMKSIIINTKKMASLCIFIAISALNVFLTHLVKNYEFLQWTRAFSFIVMAEFIAHLIAFKMAQIKFTSVYSFISLFSYVFQFGATIVYTLGIDRYLWDLRINYWASHVAYVNGNTIAFGCIVCFTIGGLFVNISIKQYDLDIGLNSYKKYSLSYYRFLGYSLSILCLPLYLYMIYYSFDVIISSGSYISMANQRLPGYITSFAKFLYVGIMALIYYYHEQRNKTCYLIYLGAFVFLISVQMITGSRSEPMTILFAFVIFYFNCIRTKKLNLKYILLIFTGGFVLANLLYSIQLSRNSGFDISDIVFRFFSNGFRVILYEFSEFGGSAMTTMTVIDRVTTHHPSWFFIKEFLRLLPISINSEYETVASIYVNARELGTTFVGELFFYFGHFCYIATFFMAVYISKIERKIYSLVRQREYVTFFMCIMWMWQEINCIRASFNLGIKTFIYSFILFTGIKWLYNGLRGNSLVANRFERN